MFKNLFKYKHELENQSVSIVDKNKTACDLYMHNGKNIIKLSSVYISITILVLFSVVMYVNRESIVIFLNRFPGLLGFFLLSFISCLSIAPIPYVPMVFRVARYFEPLPISIIVGIGSALGEAVAWSIGRAGAHFLHDTYYVKRLNILLIFLQKKGSWIIPFLAFIFSLTFLPDKLLYLPLGIMGYSIWRILPFTALGKILMIYLVVVLGRIWAANVEGYTNNEEISFLITTITLVIVTILTFYIDWEKFLQKFLENS